MKKLTILGPALAMSLCASSLAHAATFCVSDGEVLANAMRTAATNGQDDVIRIRAGVLRTTAFFNSEATWDSDFGAGDSDRNLTLSGGWNSGCTSQTIDPTLTVLDAQYFNGAVRFRSDSLFSGQVSVSNFTITRGFSVPGISGSFRPAALSVSLLGTVGTQVTIEHVILTDSRQAPNCSGCEVARISLGTSGLLRFRNNIIHGNGLATTLTGNTSITLDTNAIGYVTNNAIFNNRTSNNLSAGLSTLGVLTLSNNVIAQNSTTGSGSATQLHAREPQNLSLYNNHITEIRYSPANALPFLEQGTTSGDPMWSGTGPFRVPNAASPLRDSGRNNPAGGLSTTDARGLARVQNGIVDRGAIEALPPASTGPAITALEPLNGSTTILPATADPTRDTQLFFLTQNGSGSAQTAVDCRVTSGFGAITLREFQVVSNGGFALPTTVTMDNPVSGDNTVSVRCDVFRENAPNSTLNYTLIVRRANDDLFRNGFE